MYPGRVVQLLLLPAPSEDDPYASMPMYWTMLLLSSASCTNLRIANRSFWFVTACPFISCMMDRMDTTGTCMQIPMVAMPSSGSYRIRRWMMRSCTHAHRHIDIM